MNLPNFSRDEIEKQFLEFLHVHQLQPIGNFSFIIDGNLHRYRLQDDNPSERSGAYILHDDGLPAGFVQDWRSGTKLNWTFHLTNLNEEQIAYFNSNEFKKLQNEKRLQLELERKNRQEAAIQQVIHTWERMLPAPFNHPYLIRKHVLSYDLKFNRFTNQLAVPLCDISGNIKSIQWIPADQNSNKLFFENAPLKGLFWSIALDTINNQPDKIIFLGEGYATMAKIYELTSIPCVAALSCYKLREVAAILRKTFPNAKIIITADNDKLTELKRGSNPGINSANEVVKSGFADDVIKPQFDSPYDGSDWDDFAIKFGNEHTAKILHNYISLLSMPKRIREIHNHIEIFNAQDLRNMTFPPIIWAVDGFLPSGLSILAGGPKVGKSILALHLSLGIAIGGCVLGKINVQQGDVLYLALEDTKQRLQERINNSNLPDDCDLSRLDLITNIPRQHEGGLEYIQFWLSQHNEARLVIIDTLQKFRKLLSGKASIYAEDYEVISEIKALGDKFNVPILIIHHLKKARENEDWLNEFSGSQGLAGAADTLFSLKRIRTQNGGILHRTGRDVEEADFAMQLDGFGWILAGDAEEFTMPDWKRQIIKHLREHESITPIQLSETLSISIEAAQKKLQRMLKDGQIRRIERGKYTL